MIALAKAMFKPSSKACFPMHRQRLKGLSMGDPSVSFLCLVKAILRLDRVELQFIKRAERWNPFWKLHTRLILPTHQDLPTVLREGHISYYTTDQGPHIWRDVIVLGYATFYEINKFFVNIVFFITDEMSSPAEWHSVAGRIWSAARSLETPITARVIFVRKEQTRVFAKFPRLKITSSILDYWCPTLTCFLFQKNQWNKSDSCVQLFSVFPRATRGYLLSVLVQDIKTRNEFSDFRMIWFFVLTLAVYTTRKNPTIRKTCKISKETLWKKWGRALLTCTT